MTMSGPVWLADLFAGLMLAVAVYAAVRVVAARVTGRETHTDIDLAHLPMGVAMAAMFAPRLNFLPWWIWGVVFAALTAYFLARTVIAASAHVLWRDHYLPHTVHAGAMVYMILALPSATSATSAPAMSGMGSSAAMTGMNSGGAAGAHLPTVALLLALFMAGYTVVLANAVSAATTACFDPRGGLLYKIVMSVGMGFMLVLML
jgi:hypothetical protein